jgi:Ca2+-binding RTX toxin-like protein
VPAARCHDPQSANRSAHDLILGLAGHDTISGLGGATCSAAGNEQDVLSGGEGDDTLKAA